MRAREEKSERVCLCNRLRSGALRLHKFKNSNLFLPHISLLRGCSAIKFAVPPEKQLHMKLHWD